MPQWWTFYYGNSLNWAEIGLRRRDVSGSGCRKHWHLSGTSEYLLCSHGSLSMVPGPARSIWPLSFSKCKFSVPTHSLGTMEPSSLCQQVFQCLLWSALVLALCSIESLISSPFGLLSSYVEDYLSIDSIIDFKEKESSIISLCCLGPLRRQLGLELTHLHL